uniref:SAP domain-containing protein n=1 Tax=Cyclophora tenuis TaxID=216820 RepID=A0A7S1D336_CYCTE|mmetsp:Transcript_19444/g.33270  ORF Transcript_19444/g.33270 Transcript_19444/m.33270 type:complete len:103 (+) Transcript_19444:89-397(+)
MKRMCWTQQVPKLRLSMIPYRRISKRKRNRQQKKRKAAQPIEDDSGLDWLQLYKDDELSDCKVDQLKKYLRSVGARLSGRKEELILRVSQSIQARMSKGELQ